MEGIEAAEQQTKGLLREQTNKLHSVEAELERVVAYHKSRQSKFQNQIDGLASKVSCLTSEIEEKDRQNNTSERRMKNILEERDELKTKLLESERIRSRLNDGNNRLQAQLDESLSETRRAKRSSVDSLEAEISKNVELKLSLQRLQQSTQEQEMELQARNKETHRENTLLREDLAKYQAMTHSLSKTLQVAKHEGKAREKQLRSQHVEMQKLKSMKKNFEAERKLCCHSMILQARKARELEPALLFCVH